MTTCEGGLKQAGNGNLVGTLRRSNPAKPHYLKYSGKKVIAAIDTGASNRCLVPLWSSGCSLAW